MATPTITPALPLVPGDEERDLRAAVRDLGESFGPAYYQRVVRGGEQPRELYRALAEHGFLGVNLPEEYGGGGRGIEELAIVLEELAAAGCPMPSVILTPGIAGTIMDRHGTEEQKREWLPGFAAGTRRVSFAMTEPGAGSNSHRITTRARRDGDRYLLSGQKYYITDVDEADAIIVVARTGESPSGKGLLSLLLVDADAPGLTRHEIDTAITPDTQWQLFFDDVEVDAANLVGGEHNGLRVAFDGMNPERILFAAVANGLCRYALDRACRYARERAVWDAPIGAHQAVAHPLARGKIMLEQARLMTRAACALYDANADAGEAANIAKYASADAAFHCLDQAIQTHGGNGMAADYLLTDYWFLVRMLRIGPVSSEMVLNYVAEHSLGLPRSY